MGRLFVSCSLISTVGFQVVEQKSIKSDSSPVESPAKKKAGKPQPHIQWAEEPDVMALAGIWKDKKITLEELRKQAWRKGCSF